VDWSRRVLTLWFGDMASPPADKVKSWFVKDPAFDRALSETFGELLVALSSGPMPAWAETPEGCLAAVIVLDQFSRNIHRGTPEMYATDVRALGLVEEALAAGWGAQLPLSGRTFLYMPLMHSESVSDQERCVALFEGLLDEAGEEGLEQSVHYAREHRDIVKRFGRFPHRNAILSRASTTEEARFLAEEHGGY
jgi:uncharacterized protein (DUF924 family)